MISKNIQSLTEEIKLISTVINKLIIHPYIAITSPRIMLEIKKLAAIL